MEIRTIVHLLAAFVLTPFPTTSSEFEKIGHLPATTLVKFYAYRHVSIIYFKIPLDTAVATWKFRAKEIKTGGIFRCSAKNVTVHLKPGSIPLVNPDQSKLPVNLLPVRNAHYSLMFTSDGTQHVQNISAPLPGDWFAIAFRSWSDPNDGKIEQQGLSASCETILDVDLYVKREPSPKTLAIDIEQPMINLVNVGDSSTMRFLVPSNRTVSEVLVASSSGEHSEVEVNVTAGSYVPYADFGLARKFINSTTALVPFKIWADTFHYVTVRLLSGAATNLSITLEDIPQTSSNVSVIRLFRKSYPDFFLFDYEYLVGNGTKSAPVNLTSTETTVFSFELNPISDIGGTLTVALRLPNKGKTAKEQFTVVGCLHLGTFQDISPQTGRCLSDTNANSSLPVLIVSKSNAAPIYIHVPFPEPGVWYLSLRSFLNPANCTCLGICKDNCSVCPCMTTASGSVEISVASSPCIEGNCGPHGRCVHYMSGGFVFSACYCVQDYRGLDCSDAQYVQTDSTVLFGLLMLTLSNLVFMGSVYFAVRRRYYLEALVYFSVMFFSTFYHACESGEDVYNFCIMRVGVLQFCDFFTALLAFWVTLVAMVGMTPKLTAIFDLGGAVVLAMCAELNRTALWVFMTPAVTGSCLVIFVWVRRCRERRTIHYPAKRYQYYYFPAGLGLVILGLICYAFLQTQKNYSLVHSVWHMAVAGGVMLLLPNREYLR